MGWFSRKLHPQKQHELAAVADRHDGNAWSAILKAQGHRDVAELLQGKQRTAIALQTLTALKPLPIGASRVGGAPDLPMDFAWPGTQSFLAQLNLREVPMPAEHSLQGHVWFFGDAGGECSVHWRPSDTPLRRSERARYAACEIRVLMYNDVPELDTLTEAQREGLREVRDYLAGARAHKLFGYPNGTETPAEHRLFLQLDNDSFAKMSGGKLCFFMRDADLEARRFDRVLVT